MKIKRDFYLNRLIEAKGDGFVKILTGIRRCGKSFLLFDLFKSHLLKSGVRRENIGEIALDNKVVRCTHMTSLSDRWKIIV